MDLDAEYRRLLITLTAEGVRLVGKDRCWHQRLLDRLLKLVTLGAQRRYLDGYVTTIGQTIYLTPDWEARPLADRLATLLHERVHLRQFRRYGLLPLAVAYLLLPLPLGFAYCRMRLEREAYEETLRVHHWLGGAAAVAALRPHVIRQFTSGSYGWMWPFPRAVGRWFDRFAASLRRADPT